MDRNLIFSKLIDIENDLRMMGVRKIYIFGSVALGKDTAFSDVDLALDVANENGFSLLNLVAVQQFISENLGKSVDVVTFPIRRSISRMKLKGMAYVFSNDASYQVEID